MPDTQPDPTTAAPKRFQCRHIFTDGRRCGSTCLRHEEFCYYHHTTRKPVANPRQRRSRTSTFHLPLPEDRSAIQSSIGLVLQRIAANEIDPRRAGLLLYGLQIATLNLPRQQSVKGKEAPVETTVEEIVTDPQLGILAPRAEVSLTNGPGSILRELLREFDARLEAPPNPDTGPESGLLDPPNLATPNATPEATVLPQLQATASTPPRRPHQTLVISTLSGVEGLAPLPPQRRNPRISLSPPYLNARAAPVFLLQAVSSREPMPQPETIAVAMSGGVDSSSVAAILRAQGHTLVGLTLQLWNQRRLAGHEGMPEAVQGRCCSIDDVYDARRVAEHLDIPYYLVNQEARFEAEVVRPFVDEYLAGRTPIPCTLCNNHLKFDALLITARQIGADRIATGHYARNRFDESRNRWILSRPADTSKDQTYFLFGLTQDQLSRTLFPLGDMQKPAVRQLAADAGLALAQKPDSQEICFIPGGDYSTFLKAYLDEQGEPLPDSSGELVTSTGEVLGQHSGIHSFTVGQRKGLGLSTPDPLYVLNIHPDSHQVTVGQSDELLSSELHATRLNWISVPDTASADTLRVTAKIRHRHTPAPATLTRITDSLVRATFDEPQRAITPGQSAVFYQNDEVVGGGWIVNPAA